MKNNDLENIKRLKNLLEFLPDNKKKEMVILEYNFYRQFLLETDGLDNDDSLINENEEILAKQWELLRKTNNSAFKSVFDNIDIITEITNKIIDIHHNYPINTQIYDEKVVHSIHLSFSWLGDLY